MANHGRNRGSDHPAGVIASAGPAICDQNCTVSLPGVQQKSQQARPEPRVPRNVRRADISAPPISYVVSGADPYDEVAKWNRAEQISNHHYEQRKVHAHPFTNEKLCNRVYSAPDGLKTLS